MKKYLWIMLISVGVGALVLPVAAGADFASADSSMLDGRAYRLGFPETALWEDIAGVYKTNRYDHFQDFLSAWNEYIGLLTDPNQWQRAQTGVTDATNELILGQVLLGNDALQNALARVQTDCSYGDTVVACRNLPVDQWPQPPTHREVADMIDGALLDLEFGVQHGLETLQDYPELFRSQAGPFTMAMYAVCTPYGPSRVVDPCYPLTGPAPIKNEFAQLAYALERELYARVEKGKRLFKEATADPEHPAQDVLDEARADMKSAMHKGYLTAAIMAAAQPGIEEFKHNGGSKLQAELSRAKSLLEMIDSGLSPFGNSGLFIPNESLLSLYTRAGKSVADAKDAEIEARSLQMDFDRDQAELQKELNNIRIQYATDLYLLSGLKPEDYNNLATDADIQNYFDELDTSLREYFPSKDELEDMLWRGYKDEIGADPGGSGDTAALHYGVVVYVSNGDTNSWDFSELEDFELPEPNDLGDIGLQIYNVYEAYLDQLRITQELNNLVEQLRIEWTRRVSVQNQIWFDANRVIGMQAIQTLTYLIPQVSFGSDTSLSYDVGALIRQGLQMGIDYIQNMQDYYLTGIESDATIANINLEIGVKSLEVRQSQDRFNQENGKLLALVDEFKRKSNDMKLLQENSGLSLWSDPSYRLLLSNKHQRAEAELDYVIAMLYRLGKALEYTWAEGYENPVTGHPLCDGQLENALWDDFTELDDVFAIISAYQADDYLEALIAWDAKLREDCGGVSMRGPNHNGPFTRVISVRREMLSLEYLGQDPPFTEAESLIAFQDFLTKQLVYNPRNPKKPSFEFEFPISIMDNKFFSLNSWNLKLDDRNAFGEWYPMGISIQYQAEDGFNPNFDPVVRTQLQHAGRATIRTYWADPYSGQDDFVFYAVQGLDRPERSIFTATMLSKVNGDPGYHGPLEFWSSQLTGRSPATTKWKLVLDTSEYENRNLDFTRLEDIIITFTYSEGNPDCIFNCP